MAKGNVILKFAGVFLIIFGILELLWAVYFGFYGARVFVADRTVLIGLLMFFGFYGIVTGLFQIGTGALSFRHSRVPQHWLRCLIWGIVTLVLGIVLYIIFTKATGFVSETHLFNPQWYGSAIVIISGIVLPLIMILGAVLNKISWNKLNEKKPVIYRTPGNPDSELQMFDLAQDEEEKTENNQTVPEQESSIPDAPLNELV